MNFNQLFKYLLIFCFVTSQEGILAIPSIGYGSSDAVLPAKNQELFFMGFELGLSKTLRKKGKVSEFLTVFQVSDGSQLGAIRSAEKLVSQNIAFLVGFPTSHEALLAGEIAKKENILMIASGASHSKMASIGPTVFTTGELMDNAVVAMVKFIHTHFKNKNGILISNPYAVFSKDQESVFLRNLKKSGSGNNLESMRLNRDLLLSKEDIEVLKNKKIDYLCITSYPDESVKLMQQLASNQIDLPVVSNSSWTTGDVEFIRRFLAKKKSPVYSAALWIKGSSESLPFENALKDRYGKEPTAENAYGYDLGAVVGDVLNRIPDKISKESVINAFKQNLCFEHTTSGRICFPETGGHALRDIKFVKFTKTGFVQIP